MPPSSASVVVFLPFGSLTGVIPIDAVPQGRVLGDFNNVLAGSSQSASRIQQQIHSVIDPAPPRPRSRLVAELPPIPVVAGSDPVCAAGPPSLPSGDGGT